MTDCVRPTHNASLGLPTEIRFTAQQLPSGKAATFPIYTFAQLDNYPLMALKNKARTLVETIGADALPPLNGVSSQHALISYILDVQVSLCATIGLKVSVYDFGTPADFHTTDDMGYFGGDGSMAFNSKNFLEADYRKPLSSVQPAHRGLDREQTVEVNQAEAQMGYEMAKRRNAGSIMLG